MGKYHKVKLPDDYPAYLLPPPPPEPPPPVRSREEIAKQEAINKIRGISRAGDLVPALRAIADWMEEL